MVYEIIQDISNDNDILITVGLYIIVKFFVNEILNYYDYI